VSLFINTRTFLLAENWLLCALSSILLALILWMTLEGLSLFVRLKRDGG
jgi:hypothetical protein